MNVLDMITKAVRRLFGKNDIKKFYDTEPAAGALMAASIDRWYQMYAGAAPWLTKDTVSLRLEQGIVRELANITLSEMTVSAGNGKLDTLLTAALRDLNLGLQAGLATGAMVIKPLGTDGVQCIPQNSFIPLKYNASGRLTDVIFPEINKVRENEYLIRMERHTLDARGLTISNRAFRSRTPDTLDREIALGSVPEWADIAEAVTYPGVTRPAFGYYVNPISNTIDGSAAGVSVFASAEELIRRTDTQSARLDWEYDSAERAIHADTAALKLTENGVELPKKRLYRGLDLMQTNGELFKEFSPALRDGGYLNGLNEYKRAVEFVVGLAYGDISDPQSIDKTATEIRAAKSRKYNTVSAIQENLRRCLDDLLYALAFWNGMTSARYELSCTFKDSILADEQSERDEDRKDLAAGILRPEEYRAKWYGESVETALANLPDTAQVLE